MKFKKYITPQGQTAYRILNNADLQANKEPTMSPLQKVASRLDVMLTNSLVQTGVRREPERHVKRATEANQSAKPTNISYDQRKTIVPAEGPGARLSEQQISAMVEASPEYQQAVGKPSSLEERLHLKVAALESAKDPYSLASRTKRDQERARPVYACQVNDLSDGRAVDLQEQLHPATSTLPPTERLIRTMRANGERLSLKDVDDAMTQLDLDVPTRMAFKMELALRGIL